MRYLGSLVISAVVILLFSGRSVAGNVSMNFNSVGGNSIGGEYTYPYNFYINGSNSLTSLLCDSYDRNIRFGETWTANEHRLLSGTGLFSSKQDYEAAAIIFSEILKGSVVDGSVVTAQSGNLAIWGLFDGGRQNSGWSPYEDMLISSALASTGNHDASFYNHFVVYTPLNGAKGMAAQEFIGYDPTPVPEAATLPLLAGGLVTLTALARRLKVAG